MDGQAILTVSAAVVALTQLVKWSGLPDRLGPIAVLVLAGVGVVFWGYAEGTYERTKAFEYFAGWVAVATSAAGVFGFTRASKEAITKTSPPPAGAGGNPTVAIVLLATGLTLSTSCAPKQRHVATVSVVSAHAVLSAVQDTERTLVCGLPTAPAAPACVPADTHRVISGHLVTAFDLDGQVARLVRATPAGGPLPADVPRLISEISALVVRIMGAIPDSTQKANLQLKIGAGQ